MTRAHAFDLCTAYVANPISSISIIEIRSRYIYLRSNRKPAINTPKTFEVCTSFTHYEIGYFPICYAWLPPRPHIPLYIQLNVYEWIIFWTVLEKRMKVILGRLLLSSLGQFLWTLQWHTRSTNLQMELHRLCVVSSKQFWYFFISAMWQVNEKLLALCKCNFNRSSTAFVYRNEYGRRSAHTDTDRHTDNGNIIGYLFSCRRYAIQHRGKPARYLCMCEKPKMRIRNQIHILSESQWANA